MFFFVLKLCFHSGGWNVPALVGFGMNCSPIIPSGLQKTHLFPLNQLNHSKIQKLHTSQMAQNFYHHELLLTIIAQELNNMLQFMGSLLHFTTINCL